MTPGPTEPPPDEPASPAVDPSGSGTGQDGPAGECGASRLLARIAGALDVPVDAFFDPPRASTAVAAQASDLLAAFLAIEDPSARARCLSFVQALADEAATA